MNSTQGAEHTNLRFYSLADRLNLQGHVLSIGDEPCKSIIDYDIVDSEIDIWRKESYEFLLSSLG